MTNLGVGYILHFVSVLLLHHLVASYIVVALFVNEVFEIALCKHFSHVLTRISDHLTDFISQPYRLLICLEMAWLHTIKSSTLYYACINFV